MIIRDNLPPWLIDTWRSINNYRLKQRIPQALLVSGNKGLGKLQLTETFAASLLCSEVSQHGFPCGTCQSCHFIIADTHPDFLRLKPEAPGKVIAIDEIRNIIAKLSLKPLYQSWRVLVIEDADLLNMASANAFLKFLEEPTERTVILLISSRPYRLPATIRSRCQALKIMVPDKPVAAEWLKAQQIDTNIATLLSNAQGSPLLALENYNNKVTEQRANCLSDWINIANQQVHPVEIADSWTNSVSDKVLPWLISWTATIIKSVNHIPKHQLNDAELIDALQVRLHRLDLMKIFELYDLLLISLDRIDTQLNKQLMFEEILVFWAQINRC